MGIFEKSIPKYVVNPIDRTVEVAPQEVYVDDIFDPVFNANVRNAMRQKYGDGLYGIAGGYSELLKNTWGGDKGLFGKGMGVLSTFGRSMEKADDIILGFLTEGVEGLSGQGFDNPLTQIFVEDEDYTGKRFLASAANVMSPLVGGTKLTEEDLGTTWNVPALGVELGTDVGILGGGLARKFAPAAKNFTSKQLFENLGKSNLKTTVGEIGQLMSNYDDLMARVAIDITAPGLRPAFKKLGNKLAQWVATHAPKEFTDYEILKNNPEVRKSADTYYKNDPTAQMLDNVIKTTEDIPEEVVPEQVYKSPAQVAQELNDTEALEFYNFIKDAIESGDTSSVDDAFKAFANSRNMAIGDKYDAYTRTFNEKLTETIENFHNANIPVELGISGSDDLWGRVYGDELEAFLSMREAGMDSYDLYHKLELLDAQHDLGMLDERTFFKNRGELENFHRRVRHNMPEREFISVSTYLDAVERAQESLDEARQIVLDTLGNNWHKLDIGTPTLTSEERAFAQRVADAVSRSDAYRQEILDFKAEGLTDKELLGLIHPDVLSNLNREEALKLVSYNPELAERVFSKTRQSEAYSDFWEAGAATRNEANPTYVDDVLQKLSTPESFVEALRTRNWTTNEAVNNSIESALGDSKHTQSIWYKSSNPKYVVSPSRITKLNSFGAEGTDTARALLERARYFLGNASKPRFNTKDELKAYLQTPRMTQALKEFFPSAVSKKYAGSDKYTLDDIRKAIVNVYYPDKKGISEYTKYLEILSKYLDESVPFRFDKYSATQAKGIFLEDLYRAIDDIDQIYLQRLRDEPIHAKGAARTSNVKVYSRNESSVDDITGKKINNKPQELYVSDKLVNPRNDETFSTISYVKSLLAQASPHVKTDEDLLYLIEPLLDYVQVKPTSGLMKYSQYTPQYLSHVSGIPEHNLPEHLLGDILGDSRLKPSESTMELVNNFKSNVYPKVKAYVDKYGDYTGRYTKGAEKEYYEIRRLLGMQDDAKYLSRYGLPLNPEVNGYANRVMFEAIVDKKTGKFKGPKLSKYARNHLLEDAAMEARLSKKLNTAGDIKFTDTFSDIVDKYRKEPVTVKNSSEKAEAVKTAITNETPEAVAEQAYESMSTAAETAEKAVSEIAGEMKQFADGGGSDSAGKAIYGERKWRWFKQISDALAVSSTNAFRSQRATLRTERSKALAKRFSDFVGRYTVTGKPEDFKRFYVLRQQLLGDSVAGKDFWTEFRRSGTMTAAYEAGSKQLPIVEAALKKNAEIINKAADKPIVEVVTKDYSSSVKTVTIRFTGDTNTVKYVKKAQKALDNAKYSDVVFSPPKALTGDERAFMDSANMRELSGLMDELQALSSDQAKMLGFNFDNTTPYTRHAMNRRQGVAEWIDRKFYDKLKSEDYDDLSNIISNFDAYRKTDKGAFGTSLQGKRFRGDYWLLDDAAHSVFEYSPDKIFTSTLADGIFANLQYQDFTDLFINDNFKIKGWFNTVEDLKKVLYATDSKGKLSGNFANSELVSFKLDENGKIAGLIKYDKATDAGLAKALADENTILVPANAVSHMDNVLKKDVRMNNKFWSFINKHFTIPFKFGLLSNPGFLIGNMNDSTFKLATTMCEKYGTTITEEATKVAECINASQVLKNDYTDAFKVWTEVSAEYDIKLSPEATVPEIVAMSPKYKEDFLKWLNDSLDVPYTYQNEAGIYITEYRHVPCDLPKEVIDNASIWTMLQGVQMSSSKLREYADLADITPDSKFDVATNWFDRITQGSGKYDKNNLRTWGLFMNNPYMKILKDASGGWEDVIRTASILDDLRHGQYSKEDFAKFARGATGTEDSILHRVRLDEAKNTMFNAQFDYERQSDFISKIGKAVPFPIFFLKNFAYWMELFNKNPQFVDNVIDVQEGLWSGYNEDEDKFMTEAKGRGAVPVGGKALPEWFKGIYKPSPLQSMFGAFNLLNDPIDNLSYRVNPLIGGAKTVAEEVLPDNELTTLLQDPESVKYRPYSTNMYERNIRQGDPNFNPLAYTLHRMNPYERTINTYLRTPEKIKEGEFQLSDALPSVFQPMF